MSSIQERLQLKRVPLDTWNTREQLCLASAVVRSGDQNWMSVSRALKTVGDANRPPDWYSQKSCAAQYGALLEHVETPKRKKRSSEGAVETPQESILKRLTQERIVDIQKTVAEMNQQYEQLKTEVTEARNPNTSDERLREMWAEIETAKRARERDSARRAAWLKEREEKRARSERTWRPPVTAAGVVPSGASQPSSPLLTSLLKSSPVVTTPQHITHPASVLDTVSPSAGAPTLSMLLEKNTAQPQPQTKQEPPENKHAAIEHIKSQLVQIEQQLKAQPASSIVPAVDIDDIEIKAEDVYAFRDIQLQIPQPTVQQTAAPTYTHNLVHSGTPDKAVEKKDEQDNVVMPVERQTQDIPEQSIEQIKEEPMIVDTVTEEVVSVDEQNAQQEQEVHPEVVSQEVPITTPPEAEPEVPQITSEEIKFPEVKFPSPEIKVVTDDLQIKEEVKDLEPPPEAEVPSKEQSDQVELSEEIQPSTELVHSDTAVSDTSVSVSNDTQQGDTLTTEDVIHTETAPEPPLPPEPETEVQTEENSSTPEVKIELETPDVTKNVDENESSAAQHENEVDRREDDEDSIPLKEIMREEAERKAEAETEAVVTPTQEMKDEQDLEETHTETDDDTPMELSREEEKDGKKKRDYSRKKKPDRTYSGSSISLEGVAGAESPGGGGAGGGQSDADRHHRLWKKSVMLVYSRLCAHKYASIFQRPISDEEAPGYSLCIKRPMDLTTIRKNIEQGHVRTTAEFQRDVLLMLSNALMYNHTEHSVYRMAKDMHEEAQSQLGMLLAAQAHAGLVGATHTRKRRRHDPQTLTNTPDKKAP